MPTSSYLKQQADSRLDGNQASRKVLLVYIGILSAVALLLTLAQYVLSHQISATGGLSGMGLRSVLSAVQSFLPVIQWVLQMCLGLGFTSAMLRVSRGQGFSLNSLRLGFDRFWPLLGLTLLKTLIFVGVGIAALYASLLLYVLSPLSASLKDVLAPLVTDSSILSAGAFTLDETTLASAMRAMVPFYGLWAIVVCALILPLFYRYRLADYLLIDHPGSSPVAVLRQSRQVMYGQKAAFFKLDLSFWWYYLLSALVAALSYGDVILEMVGITLPFSETACSFLFYGVYLLAQFGLLYAFARKVSVTYACAYQALCPPEQSSTTGGVVLGNIFQM